MIPGAHSTRHVISGVYPYGRDPENKSGRRLKPLRVDGGAVERLLRVLWLRPPAIPTPPTVRINKMEI